MPQDSAGSADSFERPDSESANRVIRPRSERELRFRDLSDPLTVEDLRPSEKRLTRDVLESSAAPVELLRRLGIVSSGAESGRWGGGRLSLRGHPGREPTVSLDGVLLSSGFSGAHAEDLLPVNSIFNIRSYPFFPSLGLPHVGSGGGYDIELMRAQPNDKQQTSIRVESPAAMNMGSRSSGFCSERQCLQLTWNRGFYRGAQRVADDRNTPQDSSDDRETSAHIKDVDRLSAAARYRFDAGHGGRFETTLLSGAERRGTSGLPVSSLSEHNQLNRSLLMASQAVSFLSPYNGLESKIRLSARDERGQFTQLLEKGSRKVRTDERREVFTSLNGHISFPLNVSEQSPRLLFHSLAQANRFASRLRLTQAGESTDRSAGHSTLDGQLATVAVGSGLRWAWMAAGQFNVDVSVVSERSQFKISCGVFSPTVLCVEKEKTSSQKTIDGHVEWRRNVGGDLIVFAQTGRLSRLPSPMEVAGRPDGVVANPDLRSETTLAFNVGVDSKFGQMSFFAADDKQLISAEQVSPFLLRYENTSAARRVGFLCDGEASIFEIDMRASYEKIWSSVRNGRAGQRVVPFVPEDRWSVGAGTDLPLKWSKSIDPKTNETKTQSLRLRADVDLESGGSYWLDAQGISRLDPPWIANVRFAVPFVFDFERLETSFSVRNVFDRRSSQLVQQGGAVRSVPWSLSPVLPIEGRSFEFSIQLSTR